MKPQLRGNMSIGAPLRKVNDRPRTAAPRTRRPEAELEPLAAALAIPLNGFVPVAPTVEELRLAQHMLFLSAEDMPRVIVFSGVEPGDGSEDVCARTAEILSCLVKETVCLMDANRNDPGLHRRYGMDTADRVFTGPQRVDDADTDDRQPNLFVLPAAGFAQGQPIFSPIEMNRQLAALREAFGFVLISAPPLSTSAEGFLLGQMSDGLVLTVRTQSTQRAVAIKARRNLDLYHVRVLGAVVNEQPARPFSFGGTNRD